MVIVKSSLLQGFSLYRFLPILYVSLKPKETFHLWAITVHLHYINKPLIMWEAGLKIGWPLKPNCSIYRNFLAPVSNILELNIDSDYRPNISHDIVCLKSLTFIFFSSSKISERTAAYANPSPN